MQAHQQLGKSAGHTGTGTGKGAQQHPPAKGKGMGGSALSPTWDCAHCGCSGNYGTRQTCRVCKLPWDTPPIPLAPQQPQQQQGQQGQPTVQPQQAQQPQQAPPGPQFWQSIRQQAATIQDAPAPPSTTEAIPKARPGEMQKVQKEINTVTAKISSLESAAQKDPEDADIQQLVAKNKQRKEALLAQAEQLKNPQAKFKKAKKDYDGALTLLANMEADEAAMKTLLVAKQKEVAGQKEAVAKFKGAMEATQKEAGKSSAGSRSPSPSSPTQLAMQLSSALQGPAKLSYDRWMQQYGSTLVEEQQHQSPTPEHERPPADATQPPSKQQKTPMSVWGMERQIWSDDQAGMAGAIPINSDDDLDDDMGTLPLQEGQDPYGPSSASASASGSQQQTPTEPQASLLSQGEGGATPPFPQA